MHLGRAANEEWGAGGELEGLHYEVGRSGVGGRGEAHKYCSFTWVFGAWRNLLTAQEAWKVEWWKQTNILSTWQHAFRLGRYHTCRNHRVCYGCCLFPSCPAHSMAWLSDLDFPGLGDKKRDSKMGKFAAAQNTASSSQICDRFSFQDPAYRAGMVLQHTQNRFSFL